MNPVEQAAEMDSVVRDLESRCELAEDGNIKISSRHHAHCQITDGDAKTTSGPANNNNEDFDYNTATSGRMSSGSGHDESSAFSSASSTNGEGQNTLSKSSSSSDLNNSHHQNTSSSSSGRSSANRDESSMNELKVLNSHSNLVPEISEALMLVDTVRLAFLGSLKDDETDLYESSDIDELLKPLPGVCEQEQSLAFRLISRFLNFRQILAKNSDDFTQKQTDEALKSLKELLKFRHQYQLTSTLPEHFSKEFYILNGIFPFGNDKHNIPILYIRARVHRKWSATFDESFRRYVAWNVDRITKSNRQAKISKTIGYNGIEKDGSFGICFDCLHVSYSCLDMDFLRFLVNILINYYPTYCRYALCVDLPWLFRSVWKLVRSWLPEDAQNQVQLITSKELTDYIDEDQIPNSIKYDDRKASEKPLNGRHQFPKNYDSMRDIDGLGKELGLSSSEIKQFKSHTEKVRKEYEQLGAL